MTNLTQQPVVVEQCDRDAAAVVLGFSEWHAIVLLGTRYDLANATAVAEHFARHRLAERERCAKVAESDGLILGDTRRPGSFGRTRKDHGELIATTIRSGKEPA